MRIKIGTELELPLNKEEKTFALFKVTNFAFYGDYSAFDARVQIPYNTTLLGKIKWLFTKQPILLQQQVGVKLKRSKT